MNISNHHLLWLVLLFSFGIIADGYGQSVNFEDGFEDGNFTDNPTWSGDDMQYTVTSASEEKNNLLRLHGDPDNGGVSYLSAPSADTLGSWEFYVRLDFAPSGSNKTEIFLMSDIANLEGPVNGYALRAGESGNDDVFHIVRYDGGSEAATVLSGTSDISNGGAFRVKVTRQSGGVWTLEIAEGYDGIPVREGGMQTDATYTSANFFGIRSTYTSSRYNLFSYDFKIDLPPFTLTDATAEGNQVNVTFNRAFDQSTVQPGDFTISKAGESIESMEFPSSTVVQLTFNSPLTSDEYTVKAQDILDQHGNTIANNAAAQFIVFGGYSEGDVIINEFMYDPPNGQSEYVELKNRSNKFLNLQNWHLADNTHSGIISADTLVFSPDNFLVISPDTSVLFNIHGAQPYVESGNFSALNNDGDTVKIVGDNGNLSDSLTYIPAWGGTDVALERRLDSMPGIYRENWGESPNPNTGTPGQPNEVSQDNKPPELTDIQIISDQGLSLEFNERLDVATASDAANYSLSTSSISSIIITDPATVEAELGTNLQNAQTYTIAIAGVEDIFGNATTNTDSSFTYYEISAADSGNVAINEFSYNPAYGDAEYIEIYNPTNQSFDLKNWTLSDNRGIETTVTSESSILAPEGYAILAPDNTLLKTDPGIRLISMNSGFPALNNSGDDIVLKNKNGVVLDSLQYTSGWGGDELALERKTTAVPGIFKENWGPAPEDGGSPGRPNMIPKDQTPPELLDLYPVSKTKLQLVFSERVEAANASKFANYRISPNRDLQLVSVHADSVTLSLANPLSSGETYAITVSGITDIFGNRRGSSNHKLEYLRFKDSDIGDIVVNEIMAIPGSDIAEFVELYNRSEKDIDLAGWSLGDAATEITIPPETRLRAHTYLVLTGSEVLAQTRNNAKALTGFPNLNNSGDALFLRNTSGTTIDSLYYRASWVDDTNGYSLERKDPFSASNDPANWQSNMSTEGHSVGIHNVNFEEDTSPPKVVFATIRSDGQFEIRFNEFIQHTDDLRFTINGIPLPVSSFDSTNGHKIILQSSAPKDNPAQTITIENLADIRGNVTHSSDIRVAQPLQAGNLVINEIMYHPINDADDKKGDQSEYVELFNTSDHALSLEGARLHDAPDENGQVRELQPVSTAAKWVLPKETVLIYADPAPGFAQSRIASFFNVDSTSMKAIIQVGRSNLGLASDDAIYIADSTGATIDSVHYSDAWHNPNLVDTRGIALERVAPGGESNNRENWGSSVHSKGGTPKAENSLHQEKPLQPQEVGISFTPNPFSPDGDGYEDNLVISYKLDHPDYLLRVNIFDRYGRHIKELADGKPAGFEGSLIWAGRRDDDRRNRIGIYIIVFEAYDSASGSDKAFKKTVVLARKLN